MNGSPRAARLRRRLAGLLIALALLAAAALLVTRVVLPRYLAERIRAELRALGFEDPQFQLASVTLRELHLRDVQLSPELSARDIRVFYQPRELWHGRVHSAEIVDARIRPHAGLLELGNDSGDDQPWQLPFQHLAVRDAIVALPHPDGDVELHVGGTAWTSGDAVRFQADAMGAAPALVVPGFDFRLRDTRVRLRLEGGLDQDRYEVIALPGSFIEADRLEGRYGRASRVTAAVTGRASGAGGELELELGERAAVTVAELADLDGHQRVGPLTLSLQQLEGAPLLVRDADGARVAASLSTTAPVPLRGRLAGTLHRIHATATGTVGGAATRLDVPLEVELRRLRGQNRRLRVERVHAKLPLVFRGDAPAARGQLSVRGVAWDGQAVGSAHGTLALAADQLSTRLRCDLGNGVGGTLRGKLRRTGGRWRGGADLAVPETRLRRGDQLSSLLARLTKLDVDGATEGSLHVSAAGRHHARLRVRDAEVRLDDNVLRGTTGELHLRSLRPVKTGRPLEVSWRAASLAGIETGRGSAALSIEGPGRYTVSAMTLALAGGQVRAAPVRIVRGSPHLVLDLAVRGVKLDEVLPLLTRGQARGSGRIDGKVAVQVSAGKRPRVLLGRSKLRTRGGGSLQVTNTKALERLLRSSARGGYGELVTNRVVAALRDFRYDGLSLVIDPQAQGRARVQLRGRGRKVPQELNLTLNLNGVQTVLDQGLRLWPRRASHMSARLESR